MVGRTLEGIQSDMRRSGAASWPTAQLRWLGPEKGVVHLAAAAVVNAVWDLWAKVEGKPLWKLLADMSPEQLVACVDFSYITDALTPEQARRAARAAACRGGAAREADFLANGYPRLHDVGGLARLRRREGRGARARRGRARLRRTSR